VEVHRRRLFVTDLGCLWDFLEWIGLVTPLTENEREKELANTAKKLSYKQSSKVHSKVPAAVMTQ